MTLELLHNDPMLSVPLLVADNLDDVAADWRAWADAYRLPMLLIEADGVARTLEESLGAAIKALPAQDAPQAAASPTRRPRFLVRRKPGDLGLRLVIDGEEIIARRLIEAGSSVRRTLARQRKLQTAASAPPRRRRRSGRGRSASRRHCST